MYFLCYSGFVRDIKADDGIVCSGSIRAEELGRSMCGGHYHLLDGLVLYGSSDVCVVDN